MARVTPQQYAEKWGRRLKGATTDVQNGVNRVSEAPGEKAARAQALFLSKLMESINDGTWAAQVRGVTLDQWRSAIITKGIPRLAGGVDAAIPGQSAMAERLLAAVDAAVNEANQTPRGDLESNIQRMTSFVRGMAKRKLRRPAGRG